MKAEDDPWPLAEAVAELQTAATGVTNLEGLRSARALLSSRDFASALTAAIRRSHNQPEAAAELGSLFRQLCFAFKDQAESRREEHRQLHAVAIGGGSALVIGSVLAIVAPVLTFLPVLLLPIGTGALGVWQGSVASRRLALEISTLDDIIKMFDEHLGMLRSETGTG